MINSGLARTSKTTPPTGYVPPYKRPTDGVSLGNRQVSREFRGIEQKPSTDLSGSHNVGMFFLKQTKTPPRRDVIVPKTFYMVKLYRTYGGACISCINAIPNNHCR